MARPRSRPACAPALFFCGTISYELARIYISYTFSTYLALDSEVQPTVVLPQYPLFFYVAMTMALSFLLVVSPRLL